MEENAILELTLFHSDALQQKFRTVGRRATSFLTSNPEENASRRRTAWLLTVIEATSELSLLMCYFSYYDQCVDHRCRTCQIRSEIKARKMAGMASLCRHLWEAAITVVFAGERAKVVKEVDFRRALREANLPLTESDIRRIFSHFEVCNVHDFFSNVSCTISIRTYRARFLLEHIANNQMSERFPSRTRTHGKVLRAELRVDSLPNISYSVTFGCVRSCLQQPGSEK